MLASSSFILVIVVLGLPMWWKTTEVSRVALPYDGIATLSETPIRVGSTVAVYSASAERGALLVAELRAKFDATTAQREHVLLVDFVPVTLRATVEPRSAAELERQLLRERPIGAGEFLFMEWPQMGGDEVLVTAGRTALMATDVSSTKIEQVLRAWILEEHKLLAILASHPATTAPPPNSAASDSSSQPAAAARSRGRPTPSHTTARHLIPHPRFDVLISVLNPQPAQQLVRWDVRQAAAAYLQPLFDSVAALAAFRIKSQWLYQVALDHPRRVVLDEPVPPNNTAPIRGRHLALDQRHLPHIITALEARLGQPISADPCLHLVVYVPPCSGAPLHLYDEQQRRVATPPGQAAASDAFLSPKWGAIVIANPAESVCREADEAAGGDGDGGDAKVEVHVDSAQVMQQLVALVRRLLDIETDWQVAGAVRQPLESAVPRHYELDAFARSGCVHLLHSATRTLQSLVQLLDGIGNIVINEAVGRAVHLAFERVQQAKRELAANRLAEAVRLAREAFDEAERAFFDPSMLALLYFPDDQKFAIYIPLFLPILIPVFMSVVELWRYWFGAKKMAEAEEACGEGAGAVEADVLGAEKVN